MKSFFYADFNQSLEDGWFEVVWLKNGTGGGGSVPNATDETAGKAKLFQSLGENEDGPISQLVSKNLDEQNVKITGNQDVQGLKTFYSGLFERPGDLVVDSELRIMNTESYIIGGAQEIRGVVNPLIGNETDGYVFNYTKKLLINGSGVSVTIINNYPFTQQYQTLKTEDGLDINLATGEIAEFSITPFNYWLVKKIYNTTANSNSSLAKALPFNPDTGQFPSIGSGVEGALMRGDTFYTTASGTMLSTPVSVRQFIVSLNDDNDPTSDIGWLLIEGVYNKVTDFSDLTNPRTYPTVQAVEARINEKLFGVFKPAGNYDPTASSAFPTTGIGGGAIMSGNVFIVSADGEIGGVPVKIGDSFYALIDNPTNDITDWDFLETAIAIGYVAEDVANKTSDLTNTSPDSYPNTPAVKSALDAIVSSESGTYSPTIVESDKVSFVSVNFARYRKVGNQVDLDILFNTMAFTATPSWVSGPYVMVSLPFIRATGSEIVGFVTYLEGSNVRTGLTYSTTTPNLIINLPYGSNGAAVAKLQVRVSYLIA